MSVVCVQRREWECGRKGEGGHILWYNVLIMNMGTLHEKCTVLRFAIVDFMPNKCRDILCSCFGNFLMMMNGCQEYMASCVSKLVPLSHINLLALNGRRNPLSVDDQCHRIHLL